MLIIVCVVWCQRNLPVFRSSILRARFWSSLVFLCFMVIFFFCLNLCSSLFLVSLGSICCQLSYFAKFVQEEETWQKSLKLQDFYPWTEIYGLLKFVFPGKFSSNSFSNIREVFSGELLPENKINNKFPPPPPPCGRSWGCMVNFSQVSW